MKIKMLKAGKLLLSVMVVLAVLASSLFTVSAYTITDGNTLRWNNPNDIQTWEAFIASSPAGTGTEEDPYIIATVSQLQYIIGYAGGGKEANASAHAGKYYKMADTVKAVYMRNWDTTVTGATIKETVEGDPTNWVGKGPNKWGHRNDWGAFQGHFDGNGVVFYGMVSYGTYPALFQVGAAGATIKNVKVASSWFTASANHSDGVGGIVGKAAGPVTVENCEVVNCYFSDNAGATGISIGTVVGNAGGNAVTVKNCYASGNTFNMDDSFQTFGGLIGQSSSTECVLENNIAVGGNTIWSASSQPDTANMHPGNVLGGTVVGNYTDVATTDLVLGKWSNGDDWTTSFAAEKVAQVTSLTDAAQFAALDFANTWFMSATGPALRVFHNLQAVSAGAAGHSYSCECGVLGAVEAHTYGDGDVCGVCGAPAPTPLEKEGTVVAWGWDTSVCDTEAEFLAGVTGTGTEEDPYIIDTPDEFVYIIGYAGTGENSTTEGKFYKVADGISAFNFGAYEENATAAEIGAEPAESGLWFNGQDNPFMGNFDGNNVVFYGLHWNAYRSGLFPKVSGTEVNIKNVEVRASYFNATGEHAAPIVANNSAKTLNIDNCAVVNCYISGGAAAGLGSVVGGNGYNNNIYLENMYVANNEFNLVENRTNPATGLIGAPTSYGHGFTNVVVIGGTPWTYHEAGTGCAGTNDPEHGAKYTNVYVQLDPLDVAEVVAYGVNGSNPYRDFTDIVKNVTSWTDASQLADLGDAWVVTSTGPVLASYHNFDIVKGDATHAMTCVCGLTTGEVEHTFVDGTCVCGATCSHANTTPVAEVPADCLAAGMAAHDKCDVCGKLLVEGVEKTAEELVINALGHNFGDVTSFAGDCTDPEIFAHKHCDRCDKNYDAEAATDAAYESALETITGELKSDVHALEAQDEFESPDCSTPGMLAHDKCTKCGKLFVDGEEKEAADLETPAKDHDLKAVPEVPAQPGETGTLAHDKCEVCGKQFIDGVEKTLEELEIPALPEFTPGWQLGDKGWWYQYDDGTYATGWASIGGTWYYFDVNGWMQTGWVAAGNWYYMDASGAMVTGWLYAGGDWYYFDASGAMATGWVYAGGDWYYFDASGAMATGWVYAGGNWYYFDASGTMATGWVYVGSNWYYMDASGAMVTGWVLDGALWYWLDASGAWTGYTEAA